MGRHIIVSVHGIRTYGHWQDRLKDLLRSKEDSIVYHTYTYGYFPIFAFLIPPLRWLVVRRFRESLLRIAHKHKDARIDLVGHSFGTHIIAWGLLNTRPYLRPKVNTVILAGSVLRPSFPWQALLDVGDVGRVINDCGINDNVLWLNQLTVLFTGMAGRVGFAGLTGDQMLNRFFDGGHSLYFVDRSGKQSNEFMQRFWAPLILGDEAPERVDERGVPSALKGFAQTIIQNSEPIKVTIYALLFLIPVLLYRQLYLNIKAEHAALVAQNARNRQLYLESQREHNTAEQQKAEAEKQRDRNLCTLQWALNRTLQLPLAQTDIGGLNPDVVPLLAGIATRLTRDGYDVRLRIEGIQGQFCMDKTGRRLANPNSIECHIQGRRGYGIGLAERRAQALRRVLLLNGMTEAQIATVSYGVERPDGEQPRYKYPTHATAGEFNTIATLNSRVGVSLLSHDPSRCSGEDTTALPSVYERSALPEHEK